MLVAQLPQPSGGEMAVWFLCLLVFIGIAGAVIKWTLDSLVAVKRLREAPPALPEGKEPATRSELDNLKADVKELDIYVHAQNHELRDSLQVLTTRVATMATMLEGNQREMARVIIILDSATKELTRVSTLIEGNFRPVRPFVTNEAREDVP